MIDSLRGAFARFTTVGALLAAASLQAGFAFALAAPWPSPPASASRVSGSPCSVEDLSLLNQFAAAGERYAAAYRETEDIAAASRSSDEVGYIFAQSANAEEVGLERRTAKLDEQMQRLEVQDRIMDQAESDGDSALSAVSPTCRLGIENELRQWLATTPYPSALQEGKGPE